MNRFSVPVSFSRPTSIFDSLTRNIEHMGYRFVTPCSTLFDVRCDVTDIRSTIVIHALWWQDFARRIIPQNVFVRVILQTYCKHGNGKQTAFSFWREVNGVVPQICFVVFVRKNGV